MKVEILEVAATTSGSKRVRARGWLSWLIALTLSVAAPARAVGGGEGDTELEPSKAYVSAAVGEGGAIEPRESRAYAMARGDAELEPSKTYALIAGVLSWKDDALTSFSSEHRKDKELYETLAKWGAPRGNLRLLLDADATRAKILESLEELSRQAPADATLIFYYAGHGIKLPDGSVFFANYDVKKGDLAGSSLALSDLSAVLRKHFHGRRVFLLADCCYSGSLKTVAEEVTRAGSCAVSLTSAESTNASTGSWTFTQTIIDAFSVSPLSDRDGNGSITLSETAAEVFDAMRYREHQMSGFRNPCLQVSFVLARRLAGSDVGGESFAGSGAGAPATSEAAKGEGDVADRGRGTTTACSDHGAGIKPGVYVLAPRKGKPKPARVVGCDGSRRLVEFYNYSDKQDVWMEAGALEPVTLETYPVGTLVRVRWGGKVYDARVIELRDGFHLINYVGWPSIWDEWVMSNRIVGLGKASGVATPGVATPGVATSGEGATASSQVLVEWQGQWWPAAVLESKGDRYNIHYIGYDDSWDEWVGKDRIRFSGETGGSGTGSDTPVEDGSSQVAVEVLWKGAWYKALILEEKGERFRIHYVGYDDSWDEWVGADRIRRGR